MADYLRTILLFALVIYADCCFIMMRGAETIECQSSQELTFQVTRDIDNETWIIAECHPNEKSCFLRNQSYESNYIIANTSTGGLLVVRNFTRETFGVYKCFETYNPKKFKTIDISSSTVPPEFFQLETQDQSNSKQIVFNRLNATTNGGFALLECFSRTITTFQFMASGTHDLISIATCDITQKACYLEDDTHENQYAITYGGNKGHLLVVDLNEDTSGRYRCCETHNLSNCDTITIPLQRPKNQTEKEMSVKPSMHRFTSDISGVLRFFIGTLGVFVITLIVERVIQIGITCRNMFCRQTQAGTGAERERLN
ncbi:uncharacterized protein LOC127832114 isoform X2 [Dreissena polymorpha]|uniref:Uncharacterized protein n=2 Tax=Dreissena polymorpha TaxID=45954 RepID=A0A9D4GYU5_DREPO|nr:uncharacterized protein LOC127832114 isoform X2 [Dreissena polymorpha]KAH3825490.1 hypothetical protein DPMN_127367 [Dreissena polymorpha]